MPRRAGVLTAVAAAGVLGVAGPAAADVTVTPPSAPGGSGQNVTFRVTNTDKTPITRVKVVLPKDTPVAEVYPLSVNDWAPQIENMTLGTPLTSVHSGTPVTETAASITWIAVRGKELAPGKSADLGVALGPLPQNVSRMTFQVVPTYANNAQGAPLPAATLALTPAEPGQETGHAHGGSGTASGTDATDAATIAALAEAADGGSGIWSIAGWVLAGLGVAAAAVMTIRNRRPGSTEKEDTEAEKKELVAAGPKVTAWSYRDAPDES
jgi:hypothetical protein